MDIVELKKKYNQLLKRVYDAEQYFETCSKEDIDKYMPKYMKILDVINKMIIVLRKNGIEMNDKAILEGFKECE
ncbi:hypothetical protein [Clostridium sp. UBA4395]|uniref:hypothetical protein n=1 Tax=Clostridium sp. UBA4395 TaxID=1946360 RepID=UPI0032165F09